MVTRRRASSQTNGANGHATSALVAKLDAAVIEQRDKACAERDALRDALSSLLTAFPELAAAFATPEQQHALRAAYALLAGSGR